MKPILILILALVIQTTDAQDTFSIVAVDSITGEVGSAGASCVDLFQAGLPNDDFLGVLIPNVGAINTQAYYIPANQNNATNRMNQGDTPTQIINWLVANDVQSAPQFRQYGIAAFIDGSPQTAGHTGASTDNYKNHILGPNYAIQGNILLGPQVLDSMEARFLNEPGDLACKLMAAMQGANMVGADTRCTSNGTSSLFAFVKVAQPTDSFGNPSFSESVRTSSNAGNEPIDLLQTQFDIAHECTTVGIEEVSPQSFSIYPNPTSDYLTIRNNTTETYQVHLFDILGQLIYQEPMTQTKTIDVSAYKSGAYFIKLSNGQNIDVQKLIIE